MREIKFRQWRTKANKMIFFDLINNSFIVDDFEKCPIMQFTGLKDKNGKDIYEGDKLGYRDEARELRPGVVRWCDYQWVIIAICGDDEGNQDLEMHPDYSDDWEVIGNIYENPELIEESK